MLVASAATRSSSITGISGPSLLLGIGFEVNPSPAYSYYEANTEQPIAASLARYLAAG